jgi:PAS domain S-box-containing protein
MISGDLRIRRFTPVAEKVLHLIPTDVGRPISDLKPRINVPNLEEILQGVLDTLAVCEQEVQDFEGNWYLMRVRPYRTSDNRIQGAVLQLHDVSDLKRSLEDVRHARDYAQAIVDTVREPLLVLDEQLVVQNANRSFYDFFGVHQPSAGGQSIRDLDSGAFRTTTLEKSLQKMVVDGTRINDLEIAYIHSQTGERNLVINARALQSPEKTGLLLLAFEDATERKREEEARYRRLFEAARDGIIIVNAASVEITDVNPFVEHLCGYGKAELISRHPWDLELFNRAPFLKAAFQQIREQGVMRFPDMILCTRDGRTLHTEVVANCYSEKDGQAIQLNIRDLTERKKFESDLQHTQKLESLGLLAGGIAHDFNNLLTGILGNASLAYSDTPEDHPTRKFMRSIMDAAERAAFLTQQMLAYAGRGRFVTRPLEIGKLVHEISPLIQTSIPKNVEISLDDNPSLPAVEADPGQMQQVVMNLIINAAESIPEAKSGRVEVRTSVRNLTGEEARTSFAQENLEPGRYVCLEVKDNGSGMDEETKRRVFDPFFTTKFTGRGLGLAAVLGIMRSHRGAIRVYSTAGLGSSFQVLLPVSRIAVSPPALPQTIRAFASKGTVLVIDDEQMIRNLAAAILTRQGFKVVTAENGLAGVKILESDPHAFTLVILDFLMPVMGGEETLDRLLAIRPDLPVILSSGFDESEALYRFAGKKLAAFVNKPYDADKLLTAIGRALTNVLQ